MNQLTAARRPPLAVFGVSGGKTRPTPQRSRAHGEPIRVRIGIHTGEPQAHGELYVGLDIHRAARVMAAARGGQIVVSETTAALARTELPTHLSLRDVGQHRLKDLSKPLGLYQLGPGDFPPLRTLDQWPTNLPVQRTPVVGREPELREIRVFLGREDVRLVTVTGTGGTGKTRLALQAAADLVGGFSGRVFWVPLAAVLDPELVLPSIAQTLRAKDDVAAFVGEKRLLLLLDNLEQVLSAAPRLAELLGLCPNLKLLLTSRAPLRVSGEREYGLAPLPDADPRARRQDDAPTCAPQACGDRAGRRASR